MGYTLIVLVYHMYPTALLLLLWGLLLSIKTDSVAVSIYREMVKRSNKLIIDEYNQMDLSFRLVNNQFIGWTTEEFAATMASSVLPPPASASFPTVGATIRLPLFPFSSIDWRAQGYTTPVRDQGSSCASCYAFVALADVETSLLMAGRGRVDLAEQQLVDCSAGIRGNLGCNGGFYYYSLEYIRKWGVTG